METPVIINSAILSHQASVSGRDLGRCLVLIPLSYSKNRGLHGMAVREVVTNQKRIEVWPMGTKSRTEALLSIGVNR
jgi:hypothetical protein